MTIKASAVAAMLVALAAAACSDPEAQKEAAAKAKADARASYDAKRQQEKIDRYVQCFSGMRWQEAALKSAKVGDLQIYRDYFRDAILQNLGDKVVPAEGARPELSKANLDAYLEWSYANDVTTVLNAGTDGDKDGSVTPHEASAPGRRLVSNCVMEVAEHGKGAYAGSDKVDRMFKMEDLGKALQDKGA